MNVLTPDRLLVDLSEFEGKTLLIAEDNLEILNYLTFLFKDHFKVIPVENGQMACEIAIQNKPDIIISDVMMPIMDGLEFLRKIKSDERTSHIPVILLTAKTGLSYEKEGYETGADAYITKPFDRNLLTIRVANLLRRQQKIRERLKMEILAQPIKQLFPLTPNEEFLAKLTKIVERNISKNEFRTKILAREMGMSHSVIYKKLKSLTGFTIVEFIRNLRLRYAAMLIVDHEFSVKNACYKAGFSDRRYFSKIFKRKFGSNPSEYAKILKKIKKT